MIKKRITIIGCSVALRVRPPSKNREENKNYGHLLEIKLNQKTEQDWEINNLGLSRALTADLLRMKDQIARVHSDYIIINMGAVDAPSREIPVWYADKIFLRNGKYIQPLFTFFYQALIKRFLRKPLVYLRLKRSWTPYRKFKRQYRELLDFLLKNTSAKVILLGINPGNQRIEKQLPGTLKKYIKYNNFLKNLAREYKMSFVDFTDIKSEEHFPDGVHYNVKGHQLVTNRLLPHIQ